MTSKEYCKCPECGSECEVDTSMVLTSNPPQYEAFCKKCNKIFYTLCSNAYGKTSMNQENNITDYRNDIHRIADALEKIAKHFTEDNIVKPKEITDEEKEKLLKNPILISPSPSVTPITCEGCPIYEEVKKGKTVINDACSFCNKNPFKVTCEATNNGKN